MLFVAIGTGIGTSNATFDSIEDIHQWYSKAFVGDFFVRAMLPDFSSGGAADMPLELGISCAPSTASSTSTRSCWCVWMCWGKRR